MTMKITHREADEADKAKHGANCVHVFSLPKLGSVSAYEIPIFVEEGDLYKWFVFEDFHGFIDSFVSLEAAKKHLMFRCMQLLPPVKRRTPHLDSLINGLDGDLFAEIKAAKAALYRLAKIEALLAKWRVEAGEASKARRNLQYDNRMIDLMTKVTTLNTCIAEVERAINAPVREAKLN